MEVAASVQGESDFNGVAAKKLDSHVTYESKYSAISNTLNSQIKSQWIQFLK